MSLALQSPSACPGRGSFRHATGRARSRCGCSPSPNGRQSDTARCMPRNSPEARRTPDTTVLQHLSPSLDLPNQPRQAQWGTGEARGSAHFHCNVVRVGIQVLVLRPPNFDAPNIGTPTRLPFNEAAIRDWANLGSKQNWTPAKHLTNHSHGVIDDWLRCPCCYFAINRDILDRATKKPTLLGGACDGERHCRDHSGQICCKAELEAGGCSQDKLCVPRFLKC